MNFNTLFLMLSTFVDQGIQFFADAGDVESIRARMGELAEECQLIVATAAEEGREIDAAEEKRLDDLMAKFEGLQAKADRLERIENMRSTGEQSAGRQVPGADGNLPDANVAVRHELRNKGGFRNLGEFCSAVQMASRKNITMDRVDKRLLAQSPDETSNTTVDEEGNFAVPPDFRDDIMDLVGAEDGLLARTDQMQTSSNAITIPKDENPAWDQNNGIVTKWLEEGGQIEQSKIALKQQRVGANKIAALVPVTEELLEDAAGMASYIKRKAPEKLAFEIDLAIYNGDGNGKPLGFLQSASKIAVAKEAGQAAGTVVFDNLVNMRSRMFSRYHSGAIWLANQDIESQLMKLQFADGSPVFMPNNNIAGAPFGTLWNKPIVYHEACEGPGAEGDLMFVNPKQYMTVTKASGLRQDVSMHLFFDHDVRAFRFIFRCGGKAWLDAPITPRAAGALPKSAIVSLATRA